MLSWYRDIGSTERAVFWTCLTGWALDAMDAQIYNFLIPAIMRSFAISRGQAGLLATAVLFSSSLGGWIAGVASDRIGRVRALQITILWFSVSTFLCGFAPTYEALFILRILQGLGFGGEWVVGAILMAEIVDARHRGAAVGTVQSGFSIGLGAAALVYFLAMSLFPEDLAWRVCFWIGLVPAGLLFFVRRCVPEPLHIARPSGAPQAAAFLRIFSSPWLRYTLLLTLLTFGIQGGAYVVGVWAPTFFQEQRNLSMGVVAIVIGSGSVGAFVGFLLAAELSDRIGRRATFFWFTLGSMLSVTLYLFVPLPLPALLVVGFLHGLFSLGLYSGLGPIMSELFPHTLRGSGQGFCYNAGRATAALLPAAVGFLSDRHSMGAVIGTCALCAYVLVLVSIMLLPETKGIDLSSTPA